MINKRQYFFLSFFLTKTLFLGGGLSLLIETSRNNVLLTSFLGMILGYFFLYLFYLKERINKKCLVLLCFVSIFMMVLFSTVLTGTFLLQNTPSLLLLISLFIVVLYGSTKELNVTSRIGEIVGPVSIVISILAFLALLYLVRLFNLLPLFNTSFKDFLLGIIIFASISLLPNLVLINYKDELKFSEISKGYIIGSLNVILIMFFVISIYGCEFASIIRFPEYLILKKVDIFNYVSNIENILVLEWISNLIIATLTCVKVMKDNMNKGLFIMLILILIGSLYMLLINNYGLVLFIKNYFYYLALAVIFICLIIKKEKNT